MTTPADDMDDGDSERGRLGAWLDRYVPALVAAGFFTLIAYGAGAPGWAIAFIAGGGATLTDLERRWSNFEEEWSDFRFREHARWQSLDESFEKNRRWLYEYFEKNRR
jgi:hypothetical protein